MENMKLKERLSKPELISTIWIFLSLNYIFCDVLSNMEASALNQLITGTIEGIKLTEGFLLFAGISLEIPFAMVLLSRILPFKPNKVLNIVFPILMIIYQLGSFAVGSGATLHYIFFSAIEVAGNFAILMLAIRWKIISDKY